MKRSRTILVSAIVTLVILMLPAGGYTTQDGFELSLPPEIREIMDGRSTISEAQAAQMFMYMAIALEEISLQSDRTKKDLIPKPELPLNGTWLTHGDRAFWRKDISPDPRGMAFGVERRDVNGITGFDKPIVLSPEQRCPVMDISCLRGVGDDLVRNLQPRYPKMVQCLGSDISDPQLIKSLYDTIVSRTDMLIAEQEEERRQSLWSTPNRGVEVEDLRFDLSTKIEQEAPRMLSDSISERIKERFKKLDEERRRSGRIFVKPAYNANQDGVAINASIYFR